MRALVMMTLLVMSGCLGQPFCTSAQMSLDGRQEGWLEALPLPPDWQPDTPLAGPSWDHDGITIGAPLESGRPQQLTTSSWHALWFGAHQGGALFQGDEVRIFAHDAMSRDQVLQAASEASGGIEVGAWTVSSGGDPPYWWDFALPEDFPRNSWVAASTIPQPESGNHLDRHMGWWAWAISSERSLVAETDGTHIEVHLAPGRFSSQVHKQDATEAQLATALHAFAGQFDAQVHVDETRYRPRECNVQPPET